MICCVTSLRKIKYIYIYSLPLYFSSLCNLLEEKSMVHVICRTCHEDAWRAPFLFSSSVNTRNRFWRKFLLQGQFLFVSLYFKEVLSSILYIFSASTNCLLIFMLNRNGHSRPRMHLWTNPYTVPAQAFCSGENPSNLFSFTLLNP